MSSTKLFFRETLVRATAILAVLGLAACGTVSTTSAADAQIEINATASKAVPIALTGFTPEIRGILDFDLAVVGFESVTPDRAQFVVANLPNQDLAAALQDSVAKQELFRRAYPGGNLRAQVHALADDVVQAIRPNSKGISRTRVAYTKKTPKGSEIFVSDFDGANELKMTDDESLVQTPGWVPGQKVLYYTSYRLGNPDIYRHDLVTGTRTPVARYSGSNFSPAPSPDGSHVAFVLSKSGSPDIWVGDADGSNLRQLTRTKEDESSPVWSPDGKTLCFTSRMDGRAGLYAIPALGGQPRKVDTGGIMPATEPDWSPDGQWIAFTKAGGGAFQICVVRASGGDARVLVEGEDPTWAPNSRTLAFVRRSPKGQRTLSLLDVPTRRVKDTTSISGSCSQPSWGR